MIKRQRVSWTSDSDNTTDDQSTFDSFSLPWILNNQNSANSSSSAGSSSSAADAGNSVGGGNGGGGSNADGPDLGDNGLFTPMGSFFDVTGTSHEGGGQTQGWLLPYSGAAHNAAPFSGNAETDAALIGSFWSANGVVGTATNLTFSFPTAANQYQANYGSSGSPGFTTNPGGFLAFNSQQQTAARYAMNQLAEFSGLSFTQITELTTVHANIRFAQTTDATLGSAHAEFPGAAIQAGDVWMGTQNQPFYTTPSPGNWGQATIMHELGHAVGLKHGHQDYTNVNLSQDLSAGGTRYGSGALPFAHDGQSWSLMTYWGDPNDPGHPFEGDGLNQPQTYMQDDIAAVQYLNGANYGATANNGNTSYTFRTDNGQMFINGIGQTAPTGNIIYRTIWDGGGIDTYDLSNYTTNLSLDLRPGQFSNFGMQLANNRAYSGGTNIAPGNVANALLYNNNPASLIENAIGGIGNDTFYGNAANNTLSGGSGTDTVVFAGNNTAFSFVENNNHNYTVTATAQGTDTLNSIERFQFNDGTVTDDRIGGLATTGTIAIGGSQTGNVQFYGDRDWFKTSLSAGHYYLVDLKGSPSGGGTLADAYVRVYNSAGTQVAFDDDDGTGLDSKLVVQARGSSTFYLAAGGYADAYQGTYTLSLQDLGTQQFVLPAAGLSTNFTAGAGWSSNNTFPRVVADINGDGKADIVGFASNGTWVSLGNGDGTFAAAGLRSNMFGANSGWSNNDTYYRTLADEDGDHKADIVAFGQSAVYISFSNGDGTFQSPVAALTTGFTADTGWTSNDTYPRVLADANGDGVSDIVGFANNGTYVSLGTGGGTFLNPVKRTNTFGSDSGWTSNGTYLRTLADVNGDGKADIVAFGQSAVYVALATGGGTFGNPTVALTGGFTVDTGWTSQDAFPRMVTDVNGDGMADIVGFATNGTYVSLATGNGQFGAPVRALDDGYSYNSSWTSNDLYPRTVADLNNDHKADIIGFGNNQVFTSLANNILQGVGFSPVTAVGDGDGQDKAGMLAAGGSGNDAMAAFNAYMASSLVPSDGVSSASSQQMANLSDPNQALLASTHV